MSLLSFLGGIFTIIRCPKIFSPSELYISTYHTHKIDSHSKPKKKEFCDFYSSWFPWFFVSNLLCFFAFISFTLLIEESDRVSSTPFFLWCVILNPRMACHKQMMVNLGTYLSI
jgi:hypothetical protein